MKGDAILVKEVPEKELKIDDIISFQDGNIITTHRIVDIVNKDGRNMYITKGDNNNFIDKDKITYDKIEGKYQFKIKGFGKYIRIIQSKQMLGILILLIFISQINKTRINKKKEEREEKRKIHNNLRILDKMK